MLVQVSFLCQVTNFWLELHIFETIGCQLKLVEIDVCVRQLCCMIRVYISRQYSGHREVMFSVGFHICRLYFTTAFLMRMFLIHIEFSLR